MKTTSKVHKIAFVGDHLPRKCGIATFTSDLLAARDDIHRISHSNNQGYGAALRSAFDFAIRGGGLGKFGDGVVPGPPAKASTSYEPQDGKQNDHNTILPKRAVLRTTLAQT